MITASANIFKHKLIYTCVGTLWISTSKAPFLCACFITSSNRPIARTKTYIDTRTSKTNVFITLRKLYIEARDILICLLCVGLMAALVRLGAEKQEKMLGYFLPFSSRLYLFYPFLTVANSFFCNVTDCG